MKLIQNPIELFVKNFRYKLLNGSEIPYKHVFSEIGIIGRAENVVNNQTRQANLLIYNDLTLLHPSKTA